MEFLNSLIFIYIACINLAALIFTVYDKYAAKNAKWRVKESTLLVLAMLSGCVLQYITMLVIRHKTKKSKFMIGIPAIFFAEVLISFTIYYLINFYGK